MPHTTCIPILILMVSMCNCACTMTIPCSFIIIFITLMMTTFRQYWGECVVSGEEFSAWDSFISSW